MTQRTSGRRRLLASALSASLAAMALTVGAVSVGAAPAVAAPVTATPDDTALAQAMTTGLPVTVGADTTATSQTVANPDGTFTLTTSSQVQRVQKAGAWVDVDPTLTANSNGTFSPAAAASNLTISNGGGGPLATLDDGGGHVLSVTMPMALPKPVVTAATALYPEVLPGVDLSVTADVDGGMQEVLIVKNAAAAANPALASLRLTTKATNLSLSTLPGGAITATDPSSGSAVFTAPAPVMWDSTPQTGSVAAHAATGLKARASGADTGDLDANGDPATSSTAGPGGDATITRIPETVTDTAVTLDPPAAALTGSAADYPIYLDPNLTPAPAEAAEAYTQSYHASTTAYNPSDNLRVGFDDWDTNCGSPCYKNGVSRTFLKFTGLAGIDGKTIDAADLQFYQNGASCSGTYEILAAITNGNASFSSNLDYTNEPQPSTVTDYGEFSGADGSKQIPLYVSQTSGIAPYMAAHTYSTVYLTIYAASEGNDCTWRHFNLHPTMSITYTSKPNTPATANMSVINGGSNVACNPTSPGTWIPAASGGTVKLTTKISSPDPAAKLNANMYLSGNAGTSYGNYPQTGMTETTANALLTATSPAITLTNGANYQWYSSATDIDPNPDLQSGNSALCYFRYDNTPPSVPTVTSTNLPQAGPGSFVGSPSYGVLNLTSTDSGSGFNEYLYDIDGTGIASGGITGTTTSSTMDVPSADLHWGTNTVYLEAKDNAGNLSSVYPYTFYLAQSAFGAYTPGVAGDISGDNIPDLVTVDAAGDIQLFTDPETTAVTPTGDTTNDPRQYGGRTLIKAADAPRWPDPDNASASNALVTHAGSYHGNNVDDLLIAQNGYLYEAFNPNTGGTGTWTYAGSAIRKPICSACADYNSTDWSSVLQMVAVPTTPGKAPDLLTMELVDGVATLWLYTPNTSNGFNAPTLVSAYTSGWAWEAYQIVGAGSVPGHAGITLWVRDPASGHLYLFYNVGAGIPTPTTPGKDFGAGYDAATYPLLTAVGQADSNGDMPLWATKANGDLYLIPTNTTTAGVTTIGAVIDRSNTGTWSNHEVALGSTYAPYNNSGIAYDDGGNTAFDTATTNTYAFSATALDSHLTFATGVTAGCSTGEGTMCPYDPDTDTYYGLDGESTLSFTGGSGKSYTFNLPGPWAHRPDNYQAAGQVLPAPIPNTGVDVNGNPLPAQTITFLGAAATTSSSGATVPATITYTDGSTQSITVSFADWGSATPSTGGKLLATMPYRVLGSSGAQNATAVHLFASAEVTLLDNGQPLPLGVQIASITLGSNSAVHVFSIAVAATG